MNNYIDNNMMRDPRVVPHVEYVDAHSYMYKDWSNAKTQKVITFKNRDYLLFEGRIIDEREADRIYTQYHEILHKKGAVVKETLTVTGSEETHGSVDTPAAKESS